MKTVTEILKQCLRESGVSLRETARRTGIPVPSLSRFLRDERGLSLDNAETLIRHFGIRVVAPTTKAEGRK